MQYTQYPDDVTASERPLATFNRAAAQSIDEATKICNQRHGDYADSWSLDNLKTPWLDNLLNDHPPVAIPQAMTTAYKRLVVMASLLDIKLSRLGGSYKPDTALDTINYLGAYNTLRCEFDKQLDEYARRPKAASIGDFVGSLQNANMAKVKNYV